MKYVMFKQKLRHGTSRLVPVIFPNCMVHSDIADALREMPGLEGAVPVSAGDISGLDVMATFGSSETLGLEARETDADVIRAHDYFHGLIEIEDPE